MNAFTHHHPPSSSHIANDDDAFAFASLSSNPIPDVAHAVNVSASASSKTPPSLSIAFTARLAVMLAYALEYFMLAFNARANRSCSVLFNAGAPPPLVATVDSFSCTSSS